MVATLRDQIGVWGYRRGTYMSFFGRARWVEEGGYLGGSSLIEHLQVWDSIFVVMVDRILFVRPNEG